MPNTHRHPPSWQYMIPIIIILAALIAKCAMGVVPYAVAVSSNSITLAAKRFYYESDAPAYDAQTAYSQGDYAAVSGRVYMVMTAAATNYVPSHAKGITNGWLAVPRGQRTAAVITLHSGGPVFLAYGDPAEPNAGTILIGKGASETIRDYQGDIRAICAAGTNAVTGVAER